MLQTYLLQSNESLHEGLLRTSERQKCLQICRRNTFHREANPNCGWISTAVEHSFLRKMAGTHKARASTDNSRADRSSSTNRQRFQMKMTPAAYLYELGPATKKSNTCLLAAKWASTAAANIMNDREDLTLTLCQCGNMHLIRRCHGTE